MTSGDLYTGIAIDGTCRATPDGCVGTAYRLVGEHTRTATEDIAVVGVSVGGFHSTTLGIILVGIGIVGEVAGGERPVVALVQLDGVPNGIGAIVGVFGVVEARAYLTALNLDIGAVEHVATLATAVDGALDEGVAADHHLSGAGVAQAGDIGIGHGVGHHTLTAAEDMPLEGGHLQRVGSHDAATDIDGGVASAYYTRVRQCFRIGRIIDIVAHRGEITTAINGTFHATVNHVDGGVLHHKSQNHIGVTTLAGAEEGAVDSALEHINLCIASHFGQSATTKDVALNKDHTIGMSRRGGTDIHHRVGSDTAHIGCRTRYYFSTHTEATAIDIAADSTVDKVHHGADDGVGSGAVLGQVTGTIDVAKVVVFATVVPIHIDNDGVGDIAADIVATKDIADTAAKYVEFNLTSDVGLVGTAIDGIDALTFPTCAANVNETCLAVGMVATAIDTRNMHLAGRFALAGLSLFIDIDTDGAGDVAAGVVATEDGAE